jgi:hypothetical protein
VVFFYSLLLSVKVKATTKDKSMAIEAPMGMGLVYGPLIPLTKIMGNTAAITVKVAKIVGLPTSLMA